MGKRLAPGEALILYRGCSLAPTNGDHADASLGVLRLSVARQVQHEQRARRKRAPKDPLKCKDVFRPTGFYEYP